MKFVSFAVPGFSPTYSRQASLNCK